MGAEFIIRIKVDPSGAVSAGASAERSLGRVQNKALELNRTLRHVFGVYAIKEALTALVSFADGYTTLQNRLRGVSKDQANLNGLTNETYRIAQQTRSAWEATGMMYARMTRNSKELGYSQKEMLEFTKSLNQAVIVGGATAQEASAGLVQLSQGLASGALRGDELRSVLEQLPLVADVIAKHLGVTRGQLRQFGTEGKITARDVVEAFKKAAPELEKEFGKTVPSLAQAWTMMGNAATKFFGEIGTGTGVLAGLAKMMKYVADNFDTFGKIVISVGQAIGVYLAIMAIGKLLSMLAMLGAAIAANPFTALLYAVTALVIVLRQFGDQMDAGVSGSLVKVSDVLHVLWEDVKALGSAILNFVGDAWNALTGAFSDGLDSEGIEFSLRTVLLFIASFVDAAIAIFKAMKETILVVFGGVPVVIGEVFVDIARAVMRIVTDMVNGIISAINKLSDLFLGSVNYKGAMAAISEGKSKGLTGSALIDYVKKNVSATSGPQVDSVDWTFNNPLSGAATHAGDRMKSIWGDEFGASPARDYVGGVFDRATDRAGKSPAASATVGTDRGKFVKPPPTQAEISAYKKLWNELQSVMGGSSPITKAELDLAKAVDVTTRAVRAGMIGMDEAAKIVADWTQKTEDARHPLQAWIRDIQLESYYLTLSNNERERATKLLEAEKDLKEKGVAVTAEVSAQLQKEIQNQQFANALAKSRADKQQELQGSFERLNKPIWDYNNGLKTANQLLQDGTISTEIYQEEVRQLDETYGEFLKGLDKDFAKVAETIGNAFDTALDALVNFVVTGKGSLEDLVVELEKMVLKLLIFQIIKAALNSTGGGTAGNLIANAMFGFAEGGSFMVGGQGGPDSQVVAFRASPNERVTITRPDQAPPGSGSPQSAGRSTVHNHIHMDRRELLSALDSPDGQQIVSNIALRQTGAALAMRSLNRR